MTQTLDSHRQGTEKGAGRLQKTGGKQTCRSGGVMRFTVCMCAHPCPTLWDSMDCSPPGSSDHGLFQARILEWVAISYSRGSSQPRDRTRVPCVSCLGRWILYHGTAWKASVGSLPLFFGSCFLNRKAAIQVSLILTPRAVPRCKRAQVHSR